MKRRFTERGATYRSAPTQVFPDHEGRVIEDAVYCREPDATIGEVLSAFSNQTTHGFRPTSAVMISRLFRRRREPRICLRRRCCKSDLASIPTAKECSVHATPEAYRDTVADTTVHQSSRREASKLFNPVRELYN